MEQDCIFCKIARHEIPSSIEYESDEVIAFNDLNPEAPVHILIVPKRHITSVAALTDQDRHLVGSIFLAAKQLAKEKGIVGSGYRVVVNHGADAGQSVGHLHFHLLGGRPMKWPPG